MKNIHYWTAILVYLGFFVFSSSAFAEGDSLLFNCLTTDSVQPPVAPAGQRTLSPVALFACGSYANKLTLPKWYGSVWTPAISHSVPKFIEVDFA
jgi:hypothetical protein